MTTADSIAAAFHRGALIVCVLLSLFVCLTLFLRSRLPLMSVRLITPVLIVAGLLASPALVSKAAGPLPRLGRLAGINVDPSLATQWIPAVIAGAAGIGFSAFVLKRLNRRVMVTIGVVLGLYVLTWWPGVFLVRRQLRTTEIAAFKLFCRELESRWARLGWRPLNLEKCYLEAEALQVEINRAIPIAPALIRVHYRFWGPVGPVTTLDRVVIWYGPASRYLSYQHADDELGLPEDDWTLEELVPEHVRQVLLVTVVSIVGTLTACELALWFYRRHRGGQRNRAA